MKKKLIDALYSIATDLGMAASTMRSAVALGEEATRRLWDYREGDAAHIKQTLESVMDQVVNLELAAGELEAHAGATPDYIEVKWESMQSVYMRFAFALMSRAQEVLGWVHDEMEDDHSKKKVYEVIGKTGDALSELANTIYRRHGG